MVLLIAFLHVMPPMTLGRPRRNALQAYLGGIATPLPPRSGPLALMPKRKIPSRRFQNREECEQGTN